MINIWLIVAAILVLYLLSSIKILREYERGVVFRLGPRAATGQRTGPCADLCAD